MKKLHSKTIKIFGPPGTGKTTKLLGRVEKYLERGVKPNEVAYFSFTRKAVKEAVERFKFINELISSIYLVLPDSNIQYNEKKIYDLQDRETIIPCIIIDWS